MIACRRTFLKILGAFPLAAVLGRRGARSDNKHISRLLEQGAELDCVVIEVDPNAGMWNMVRVEVVFLV